MTAVLRALFIVIIMFLVGTGEVFGQTPPPPCKVTEPYGNNPTVGRYEVVKGIRLYYEIYGSGSPLMLAHGNSGSIGTMACRIAVFSVNHRVIAVDSRARGKSEPGEGRLTYEQIADDHAELLKKLNIGPVDVVGHSDGGIITLLLAIRHPTLVKKVVSSSPNLRPDPTALFPWFVDGVRARSQDAAAKLKAGDTTQDWKNRKRVLDLMLEEPHIPLTDLKQITAPVLVMGADSDIMPLSHLVEIYSNIPQAQLFIMPGATHRMTRDEFDAWSATISRFLDRPFQRPVGQPRPPQ
jgi:pimeloyl-ACP methyl ester carboxylesterase